MKLTNLKPYYWIGYPLAVVLLILFSLSFTFGGENQLWSNLIKNRERNSENQKSLARLNTKLAVLKQANASQMTLDLAWMLQVMPNKKQFDSVVNELRFAGQNSGSTLGSYKTQNSAPGGLTLSAKFAVPDFSSAQQLIASLQNTLPLLSVTDVEYSGSSLSLTVTSAWSPTEVETVKIDDPLPESVNTLPQLKNKLSAYQAPVIIQAPTNSSASAIQLPLSTDPFGALPVSN